MRMNADVKVTMDKVRVKLTTLTFRQRKWCICLEFMRFFIDMEDRDEQDSRYGVQTPKLQILT